MILLFDLCFFVLIPSIISTIIQIKKSKYNFKHSFTFYFVFFFVFISFIKTLLNEGNCTLIESFLENGEMTYLHYAIPIYGMAIVLPFLLMWVFGRKPGIIKCLIIAAEVSVFISTSMIMFGGRITNIMSCVSTFCGILCAVILHFKHEECVSKENNVDKKQHFVNWLRILAFWTMSFILFIPNKIYLTNPDEFHIGFGYFFGALSGGAIFIVIILSVICSEFISVWLSDTWCTIIFSLTLVGYIQMNFLNGNMSQMDGRDQVWSTGESIGNIAIWITILTIVLVIFYRYKEKSLKWFGIIALYISMVQVFTLGYLWAISDKSDNIGMLTKKNMYELGDESNTVVFILDWYDEQILDEIVEQEPDFLSNLEGFVWYRNQTSRYAFTHMSIPYLLTNVRWKEGMDEVQYTDFAFENGSFLDEIANNGYNIGIYTDPQLVRNENGVISNYTNSRGKCKPIETIIMMTGCARYEMAPFYLKNKYHYSTGDMTEMVYAQDMYYADNYSFYMGLMENGLSINSNNPKTFRFYHIAGCHDLVIDEDINQVKSDIVSCGKGTLKIVFSYLNELKRLNIYDNTTVIITADHGQNALNDEDYRRKRNLKHNTSSPILLLKQSRHRGDLVESWAPVSHDDFCASVIKSVGGNPKDYGRLYYDVDEKEDRIREFEYYRSNDIPYEKYYINGLVTNERSWSLVSK